MAFSSAAVDERRQTVAAMLRQGYLASQIARQLNVSQATISLDIKALRVEWRKNRDRDRDIWMDQEIAKLDALEAEAWQHIRVNVKGKLFGVDRVLAVMERRAKMLGLEAPTRIDLTANLRERAMEVAKEHDLNVDEVMAEMEAILSGRDTIAR